MKAIRALRVGDMRRDWSASRPLRAENFRSGFYRARLNCGTVAIAVVDRRVADRSVDLVAYRSVDLVADRSAGRSRTDA